MTPWMLSRGGFPDSKPVSDPVDPVAPVDPVETVDPVDPVDPVSVPEPDSEPPDSDDPDCCAPSPDVALVPPPQPVRASPRSNAATERAAHLAPADARFRALMKTPPRYDHHSQNLRGATALV